MASWLSSRRVVASLLAFALAGYVALLAGRVGAYAGAADSSGYLNQARLLRAGKIHTLTRALPELPARKLSAYAYVPLGFSPANPGDPTEMVANYPIGLPLLLAAASFVCGWELAPPVTMIAHALTGIALMIAWAQTLRLSTTSGVVAAALLAMSPLYLFAALQTLSDLPALVWTTLAVLGAWRSRERAAWAAAAGFAFGLAVLIRPTNALALLPIAVALGRNARGCALFGAGGLPALATFLFFNAAAYGGALRTGYGPIWDAFQAGYIPPTLWHYARWLPVVLTPAVLLAGALPWATALTRRERLLLALWLGAFFGFYLSYSYTHDTWWYLRFLLPAFPPIILAMLAAVETWRRCESAPRWRVEWSSAALLAMLTWLSVSGRALRVFEAGARERGYVEACAWARAHLPADAVVFAMQTTGALYYYTDFPLVQWTLVNSGDIAALETAARASGRPVFAMLFPFEEAPLLRSAFPGNWTRVGEVGSIRFWRRGE